MPTFEDREKGEEARYACDQEATFKITARRNKLLGLWVAEKMGMSGETAQAYAREVIEIDFDEPGEEDVYRKVAGDLAAKGVALSERQLRREMARLAEVAREQIDGEAGAGKPS